MWLNHRNKYYNTYFEIYGVNFSLSINTLGKIRAFSPKNPFIKYHFTAPQNNSEEAYGLVKFTYE